MTLFCNPRDFVTLAVIIRSSYMRAILKCLLHAMGIIHIDLLAKSIVNIEYTMGLPQSLVTSPVTPA
jgi:hypothetical protein